jgi:hypothetical protein
VGLKSLKSLNLTNVYPNNNNNKNNKKKKKKNNKVKSKPLELRSQVKIYDEYLPSLSAANVGSPCKQIGGLGLGGDRDRTTRAAASSKPNIFNRCLIFFCTLYKI